MQTSTLTYEIIPGSTSAVLQRENNIFTLNQIAQLNKIRYKVRSNSISPTHQNNTFTVGGTTITLDPGYPSLPEFVENVNINIRDTIGGSTDALPQIIDRAGSLFFSQKTISGAIPFKNVVFTNDITARLFGFNSARTISNDKTQIFPEPRMNSNIRLVDSNNSVYLLPSAPYNSTVLFVLPTPIVTNIPDRLVINNDMYLGDIEFNEKIQYPTAEFIYLEFTEVEV